MTYQMAFIVFEGLDGSGKTTLIKRLSERLDQDSISHIITREPGGTPLGDELREIILRKGGDTPSPRTELLLYEASRAQHVDKKIKPALDVGQWVLCDRFTASSMAFQAGGRSLDIRDVEWLNNFATHNLKPHLFVLLDLTVEESIKRREGRQKETNTEADRLESEKRDFHERTRQGYLDEAKKDPVRWLVLDASKSPDELFQLLLEKLQQMKLLEV
jgi:dTMP kinase